MIEKLNKEVFPDPSTRPSYITVYCTHIARATELAMAGGFYGYTINYHNHDGYLLVGPLARTIGDGYTPMEVRRREDNVRYLSDLLLKVPGLKGRQVSEQASMFRRVRRLVIDSIIGPLTVKYECLIGEIFDSMEKIIDARELLTEASRVVNRFDENLSYFNLEKTLIYTVINKSSHRSTMFNMCVY